MRERDFELSKYHISDGSFNVSDNTNAIIQKRLFKCERS